MPSRAWRESQSPARLRERVREGWRGRRVNLATAGRSFLTMAALGMRYAGYTLVLDDNWASRATAQKLGASITGNFVVYRRQL